MRRPARTDLRKALAQEGYTYAAHLADLAPSPDRPVVRKVRVHGTTAWLVAGRDAAALLGDSGRIARCDDDLGLALPGVLRDTKGRPDSARSWNRQDLHDVVFASESIDVLARAVDGDWATMVPVWMAEGEVELQSALAEVLLRAIFSWLGVRDVDDVAARARDLVAVMNDLGITGRPRDDTSAARERCLLWARAAVRMARTSDEGHIPLRAVALAVDDDGHQLPERAAAAELLDLIRPAMTCAWLGSFVPLALADRPGWLRRCASDGDIGERGAFVDELRRHYPYTAMLAGRARTSFRWFRCRIHAGDLVLLQVVATHHDPHRFPDPWQLRPERFLAERTDEDAAVEGLRLDDEHLTPAERSVVVLLDRLVLHLADLAFELLTPARFSALRIPTTPDGGPRILVGDALHARREGDAGDDR